MNKTLSFEIHNDMVGIKRADRLLDEFGLAHQFSNSMNMKLKLAVEELLTNIISYGYNDEDIHTIELDVTLQEDVITVRITHDAVPFNPHDAPPPPRIGDTEDIRIGGLGVFLVKETMDSLDYRRDGRKSIIEIKKTLS